MVQSFFSGDENTQESDYGDGGTPTSVNPLKKYCIEYFKMMEFIEYFKMMNYISIKYTCTI